MLMVYIIFIFSYILWTIALLGVGSIVLKIIKQFMPGSHLDDGGHLVILISGILGMAAVTTLATIINFFVPISLTVSIIIMVAGLVLFIVNRKELLKTLDKTEIIFLSAFSLLIAMIIPLTWVSLFDTGSYHLPTIKWIIESQVPLGLANLHGRFGFNNSWFMLSACIDQWVVYLNKPYFSINGILIFFYVSAILLVVKRKFFSNSYEINGSQIIAINKNGKKYPVRLSDLFLIISSIALVYPGLMLLTTPSPDLPGALFTLFIVYLIIYDLENSRKVNFYTFIAVIISIYSITVKLSAIVLGLVLLLLIFRSSIEKYVRKSERPADAYGKRNVLSYVLLIGVLSLLVIPWMIRGLLLSGCLFFPFLIGYFPQLQWAVPAPIAASEVKWTIAWARLPGPDALNSLSGWGWVLPWVERQFNTTGWLNIPLSGHIVSFVFWKGLYDWLVHNLIVSFIVPVTGMYVPLILFMAGMIGALFFIYIKKVCVNDLLADRVVLIIPIVISIIGTLFWFYSAPELRFGFGFIYSFAILILSIPVLLYFLYLPNIPAKEFGMVVKNRMKKVAIAFITLMILYSGCIIIYYSTNTQSWGSDGFNFPQVHTNESITSEGTVIYTPAGVNQLFWDGPLPNSLYFNASLKTKISNTTGLPNMFWYDDKNSLPIIL